MGRLRGLIFDPFAGISGDMILGALVDLGLSPDWLKDFVASLGLGDVRVVVERAVRRGISCGRVYFELPHEHAHRHLRHVLEIIDRSAAPAGVKARASAAFRRLAEAEAEVHGTTVERVHFHEVGALDAILDVLCAMAGIAELGFERCYTLPVAVGSGWVEIEHGRFPVPAPATLKLLEGLPILLLILAFPGKYRASVKWSAAALIGMIVLQYITANVDGLGLLHPVIALFMFLVAYRTAAASMRA